MSVILRQKISGDEFDRANPPKVLTFDECSKFLRVSAPTLRELIRSEGLPCRVVGKSTRLFSTDAVVRWIEGNEGENVKTSIGFLQGESE